MKVMLAVVYLTLGVRSMRPCPPRPNSIEELERSVYYVARDKGVPPTVVVNRILRKVRFRLRAEKMRPRLPLQDLALKELLESMSRPPLPASGQDRAARPPESRAPPVYGAPQYPPSPQLTFPPESKHMQFYPQSVYVPVQSLMPPPGVTVRVNAGGAENALPEVTVTLSPMMTIVEALRQADAKFRQALGLPPMTDDVIAFGHSSFAGCYVISRFDTVEAGPATAWKVHVSDRSGRVIYDSVCLPGRAEVAVKPGMTITLKYASL